MPPAEVQPSRPGLRTALHHKAAEAHESATAAPLDPVLSRVAMRASAMATEVSQRLRKQR